jgi:hypothetical protein
MTRSELLHPDCLLVDLDWTFLDDSALHEMVDHDGGTASRPYFTGPAQELELDSWTEANGQGLDPGHLESLAIPGATFLGHGSSRLGPVLRRLAGSANPRTGINLHQPEVLPSLSVGTHPSRAPYEPILNSSASSALHSFDILFDAKAYISPTLVEPSFHTRLLPARKEPSTSTEPTTPNQQPRLCTQYTPSNQGPAIGGQSTTSPMRNFDPALRPEYRTITSTNSVEAVKGLKNPPKENSADPHGPLQSEGGQNSNLLPTKCSASSATTDTGPSGECIDQSDDHGELLFDLKMQPTQPRRLRKKTCEERLHSLRLRRLGGACEKHKLNKRAVSDTLPAQPPVRRLKHNPSVTANCPWLRQSSLFKIWMEVLQSGAGGTSWRAHHNRQNPPTYLQML